MLVLLHLSDSFADFQWSEKINYTNVEADADDEFLPDCNESNMFVLERASDVAMISSPLDAAPGVDRDEDDDEEEECSDDIPAELLIPDVIPEIDENSTDEDDDLVPLQQSKSASASVAVAAAPADVATSTKMDFCKGHFKRDSSLSTTSSSSEESLSKGLQFPDHTTVDAGASSTLRQLIAPPSSSISNADATIASNLLAKALLPSLVSSLVQWGTAIPEAVALDSTDSAAAKQHRRQVTALDSSDDSDFEILQVDDCK